MTSWEELRHTVAEKAKGRCRRCRRAASLTAHHIRPRSEGGRNTLGNLIALCAPCHDWVEIRLDEKDSVYLRTRSGIEGSYPESVEAGDEFPSMPTDPMDDEAWRLYHSITASRPKPKLRLLPKPAPRKPRRESVQERKPEPWQPPTYHPANQCGACGEDFSSLRNFDRHRVGVHEYTYSEGLKLEPIREDGRRCLDADEIQALGLVRDKNGRWSDPEATARAQAAFVVPV